MKLELNISNSNSQDSQDESDPYNFLKKTAPVLKILMPQSENYNAVEIDITFTDADNIRDLNATYRNVDEATDVLSFPMIDDVSELEEFSAPVLILGDVVICEIEVLKMHSELNHDEAICLMLAHSFLHLLGYDHDTPENEQAMWKLQDEIKIKMLEAIKGDK